MKKQTLIIYHGDCPDGFGAAYSAYRKFGDEAEYHPGRIGEEIPDVKDRDVYILDFSYSPEKYQRILELAKSVQLIDHHASARDKLQHLPGTYFDMDHSGCMLAWMHFWPDEEPPPAMKYIEDYDLWAWKYEDTMAFILNVKSHNHDMAFWEKMMNLDEQGVQAFIEEGRHIERHYRREVELAIKYGAKEISFLGKDGYIINASKCHADLAGNILAKRKDSFAIIWHVNEVGQVNCSVRSVADCSAREIAETYGGGGHKHAARFNLPSLDDFNELLAY